MSLSGSRGLARISQNLKCRRQAAMVAIGGAEPRFYERLSGTPYRKEYGERQSAFKRGVKFEDNLFRHGGERLKQALAPLCGKDSGDIYVRNLRDECPGEREQVRFARLSRTRRIISDAISGKEFPDIVIQPQLELPVPGAPRGRRLISPDCMVWIPEHQAYTPGDLKSFVVRENEVDPGDLRNVRLQVASQILALRHEFGRHGVASNVTTKGFFVFATPFGLQNDTPRIEDLGGPIDAVQKAIEKLGSVAAEIDEKTRPDGADPRVVLREFEFNFQERCHSTCVLASICKEEVAGRPHELGDAAVAALGEGADLGRITALMTGSARPADAQEAELARRLRPVLDAMLARGKAA